MVADFLTKPLQGAMVKRFRDLTMGVLPNAEVYKVMTRDNVKKGSIRKLITIKFGA